MGRENEVNVNCRKNRAITLIALVITIIILLILSGVVINFVINGGILDKARTSSR